MNVLLQILFVVLFIEPQKGNTHNCRHCKHFVKPIMNENIHIGDYFGKCKKFFTINYSSNELSYKFALSSRVSDKECGLLGRHFEPRNVTTKSIEDCPL